MLGSYRPDSEKVLTDQIAQTSDFHKSEVLDYITLNWQV
jgi:hypothetical protein